MEIPFLDLYAHHSPNLTEFDTVIREVISESAFTGGRFVQEFESEFSKFCHSSEAIGVGSGTEAIWLALLACGVGQGDEVITVPNTFIATAEAISLCGARPVFVDVEEATCLMNPEPLEAAISNRTKAIIPVHLYGQTANMDPILEIAERHRIPVIEDACQAHGADYKGRRAGSMGHAGAFSFYPGKNLGAFGDAGAVVTNDSEIANRIRIIRDHGQSRKYDHAVMGWNCRMDGLQGAVLRVKLKNLEAANARRREIAAYYFERLRGTQNIILPAEVKNCHHVYHIFAIRTSHRESLIRCFQEDGIGFGIHYPIPIHLQKAYQYLAYRKGDFPVAENVAAEIISLPMYPELRIEQIDAVVNSIIRAHKMAA